MCNVCEHKYTKENRMTDHAKGGRCPECTSEDTRQTISTPRFKPCGGGHSNTIK
ncbi:MAG: hypothetical protein NZ824_10865 [Candidatus Thioglobus sp.]|nr:hypothetical protein [Candidatus Thioglobus sp.]